jgi:hypothetical protein
MFSHTGGQADALTPWRELGWQDIISSAEGKGRRRRLTYESGTNPADLRIDAFQS